MEIYSSVGWEQTLDAVEEHEKRFNDLKKYSDEFLPKRIAGRWQIITPELTVKKTTMVLLDELDYAKLLPLVEILAEKLRTMVIEQGLMLRGSIREERKIDSLTFAQVEVQPNLCDGQILCEGWGNGGGAADG